MSNPFIITRLLNAPRNVVWDVYTKAEHLAHWLGPKGSKITYCKLDFKVGGTFLYAMEFNGMIMWAKWQFKEIVAPEKVVLIQCFSDENGGITQHPMAPDWPSQTHSTTTLVEQNGKTLLTLEWLPYNATPEQIAVFNASFDSMNQGWGGNFDVLDDYLNSIQK